MLSLSQTKNLAIRRLSPVAFAAYSTAASVSGSPSSVPGGSSSFKTTKVIENNADNKPNVVILGSGWGAISFLQHIDAKKYNVSIVSPRNYFLFTPLLPSTPVGTVDEKSIIEPVVNFALKKKGNVSYYEAEATSINPDRKTVTIKSVSTVSQLYQPEKHLGLSQEDTAEVKYCLLYTSRCV